MEKFILFLIVVGLVVYFAKMAFSLAVLYLFWRIIKTIWL